MRHILTIFLISFIFLGCSQREYFEPSEDSVKHISAKELNKTPLDSSIKTFNRVGATLNNNKIVLASGIQDKKLKDDFNFINEIDGTIISADNVGKISINDLEIDLGKVVVAATIKENFIAIVFIDNSIGLYDINKKQMIFKDYYKESLVNDIRIANPIFMTDIVLFPTLDGKAIVLSLDSIKVIRTIIVDSSTKFNNISFFEIVNETLIATTANQIISLNSSSVITKEFEIRDILIKDGFIYLATLDGQLLKLDSALNVLAKRKFKYAKIYSLGASKNHIYALESQGFLIQLNKDLTNEVIYSFGFDNSEKSITLGDKIYFQTTSLADEGSHFINKDFYITLP